MDLSTLNDMQKQAVTATDGALLVLAGAGSGKTRVLTYRIAYIIEQLHVSPYAMLALTFTNKAAAEMKERTESLIGECAHDMWVTTFHSFCAKILRIDGSSINLNRNFTIYDESNKKTIISGVLNRMGLDSDDKALEKSAVCRTISDAKNSDLSPEVYLSELEHARELIGIYHQYQDAMRIAQALDFDDLILTVLRMFNECPDVLEKYRNKFHYVMVDEYQDTNMSQYELVRLICSNHGNVCVVGDDDQSIYGWRGATIRNILEFENDFPNAQVIRLEQNYRSSGTILKAANEVIQYNTQRKGKNLWTKAGSGDKIIHYCACDEYDEAKYIAREIERSVESGAHYNEHAVLYRTNAQSRVLESTFTSFAIPYKVYGGFRFYERMEVCDIIAYLRLISNPNDDAAFKRAVNIPPRGIGEKSVQTLELAAANNGISLLCALMDHEIMSSIPAGTRTKLQQFADVMNTITKLKETSESASLLAKNLVQEIGYIQYLITYDDSYANRCENLDELLGSIAETERGMTNDGDALSLFLENAALISDIDGMDDSTDTVSLMTVHSAKGLEFFTVFVAGLEEDLFPSSRSKLDPERMEEERRLCYVAITRARRKLHLVNTLRRRLYNRYTEHNESRFLAEIPEYLLAHRGSARVEYHSDMPPALGGKRFDTSYYGASSTPSARTHNTAKPSLGTTTPVPSNIGAVSKTFKVGMRITHTKFGNGVVDAVSGSGTAMAVTIIFDTGETKKFAAMYAPLSEVQ